MHITKIQLNNFRNYETAEISPCPGVTVLYGNNAQGKTALVESIILCCTGRSHRTPRDKELIRWEQPMGHVRVEVERSDGPHEIDLTLNPSTRKIVKIGGRTLQKTGELMGHLNGVLFAPEDLRIVKDGPAERRRFIDMELSQIRPGYYYALQLYNRALNQRNSLLREIAVKPAMRDLLDDWDAQLAKYGADIMERRRAFISLISQSAEISHREISGGAERLTAAYQPAVASEESGAALMDTIRRALKMSRENDIRRGTSTVGPHRDDLALLLSGMDVRVYGSQGQQRTAALSMKLAELDIMHRELGEWPVLLLDDVMSELDPGRRRQLLRRFEGVQTIVTCTDMSDLAEAEIGAAYRIENGTIQKA